VLALRTDKAYSPLLHFDLYGTAGIAFDADVAAVADYLTELARITAPFALSIEHPIDAGSRQAQIDTYVRLRSELAARGSAVRLAVDEWCNTLEDIKQFVTARAADIIHVKTPDLGGIGNTVEALLLVHEAGLATLCGGSCAETEVSARVCSQVAMACSADAVLAKPGMGVDEGLMIVRNEMRRTAALYASRTAVAGHGN
jgi:methylaspartate ammonia-lyase